MKKSKAKNSFFGLTFIATGKETNGKYFLCRTTIPAGDSGPLMHTHLNEDEGFFLTKGKMKFYIDGSEIALSQGEFLNIQKGERHTWKNDSNEDAELVIIFTPAGIESMFMDLDNGMDNLKEIGLKYGTKFESNL